MECIMSHTPLLVLTLSVLVSSTPYVTVEQGTLFGTTVDFVEEKFDISTKVNLFRGIPYGEPPERFGRPVKRRPWTGEWNATTYGNSCYQTARLGVLSFTPLTLSEDCLYLNVYAPNDTSSKLPVMVFIHGGGFVSGSSMDDTYSGLPIAAIGGVVVVTLNYRLSVFGFLSTGDDAAPGNYGLLDQVEALRWVRGNIEAFGGDNSKITIFGESVGATCVDLHLLSKQSRDLFDQAILEGQEASRAHRGPYTKLIVNMLFVKMNLSGSSNTYYAYSDDYESLIRNAFAVGNAVNCTTTDTRELVECLRQVDAMVLQDESLQFGPTMIPTKDGVFLDDSPLNLLKRGDFKEGPLLLGFNKDDGTLGMIFEFPLYLLRTRAPPVDLETFNTLVENFVTSYSGENNDLAESAVKQQYVDWSQYDDTKYDYFEEAVQIYTDMVFSSPMTQVAITRQRASQTVYMYMMTHVPSSSIFKNNGIGPGWLGAGHGEELQFVFGYPFLPELYEFHGEMTEEEIAMSVQFIQFWSNFAKTGDPSRNSSSEPLGTGIWAWPKYTEAEKMYKDLSLGMSTGSNLKADESAFWNNFMQQLQIHTASLEKTQRKWTENFSAWQQDHSDWLNVFQEYQSNTVCNANEAEIFT